MINQYRHPDVTGLSGGTSTPAQPMDKTAVSLVAISILGPTAVEASHLEVSHDYNPNVAEAAQTPTWSTLQDSTGTDVPAPLAGKTRQYAFYASAWRITINAATFGANRTFQATVAYNDS